MINGFLLIDKDTGPNSFKLVVALRKLTHQRRIGFAGTLDPLASGLMILAIGEYTKLLSYLEAKDKVYQVTVKLGVESDTYDSEGEIKECRNYEIPSLKEIETMVNKFFVGKIDQKPPRFSAIQINGQRAYDLARKGEDFELKTRTVEIFYTTILDYSFPLLKMEVHCSSGTYIRSIAHDLGEKLGCGGMVVELRRTAIGKLKVEDAIKVDQLSEENLEQYLVPAKTIFAERKTIDLSEGEYQILARGNFINDRWHITSEVLAYYNEQLVGVVERFRAESKLKFKKRIL